MLNGQFLNSEVFYVPAFFNWCQCACVGGGVSGFPPPPSFSLLILLNRVCLWMFHLDFSVLLGFFLGCWYLCWTFLLLPAQLFSPAFSSCDLEAFWLSCLFQSSLRCAAYLLYFVCVCRQQHIQVCVLLVTCELYVGDFFCGWSQFFWNTVNTRLLVLFPFPLGLPPWLVVWWEGVQWWKNQSCKDLMEPFSCFSCEENLWIKTELLWKPDLW